MSDVKAHGPTEELHPKLRDLSTGGESGILGVAVRCVDIKKNTGGEGGSLECYWRSYTKVGGANRIRYPGSPNRKRCALGVGGINPFSAGANALSAPPGEYGRKAKTQRN